jgi:hypothetical protein
MEDLTSRPAVSRVAPAGPLTPAARLTVSLLPDPHCHAQARRESMLRRIFASWVHRGA